MIRIDEKHPAAVALRSGEEKLRSLEADRAKEAHEIDRLTQLYLSRKQSNKQALLEHEADQLLGGKNISVNDPDNDLKNIEAAEHRVRVLDIAIRKQRNEVDTLRSHFSTLHYELNRAEYVRIEHRIAKAVQELAAANEQEVRFFQALTEAGCSSIPFRPMRVGHIGLASDNQSVAAFHRREVKEFCPEAAA